MEEHFIDRRRMKTVLKKCSVVSVFAGTGYAKKCSWHTKKKHESLLRKQREKKLEYILSFNSILQVL